ncbi:MAG: hypothetical protein ACOX6T_25680 [Myxococcales bacterium]|jgi:hypothetical protein
MQRARLWAAVSVGLLALLACGDERVTRLSPEIALEQESVDFGTVRVGKPAERPLKVLSKSRSSLAILAVTIEDDPEAPGGAASFSVAEKPDAIDGDSEGELVVRFKPSVRADFKAVLLIESDDPDPEDSLKRVALVGRGGKPKVRVLPECTNPCSEFSSFADPPSIDFGQRSPLRIDPRGQVLDEPVWPTVTVINDGELPLELVRFGFDGDDAFRVKQPPRGGMFVESGPGQSFELLFDPRTRQDAYRADLLVVTDDPDRPEVRVRLTGRRTPNLAPTACAAIVEVRQPDGSVDYPRDAQGAYSFGAPVPVHPGEGGLVMLSAFSDHFAPGLHPDEMVRGDPSGCSTDPEDGRLLLTYEWIVVEKPEGSAAQLLGGTTPEPAFRPDKVGHYALELRVTDTEGASATAQVAFDALPKRDMVVELSWAGQPGIDLDVHLVKPGPCGGKPTCLFDKQGDVNGYSWTRAGGEFDWGEQGKDYDDPRLELDDQGDEGLVESVSLNRPENDPSCAANACTYDVYVHYFKDWRAGSPTAPECPARPCHQGDACGCATTSAGPGAVCVSGRCVQPARPVVKVFVRPTPDAPEAKLVVPLPPDEMTIGGPCFVWHAARIVWPSREALFADPAARVVVQEVGVTGARSFLYYGSLAPRSFSCAPNTPQGTPESEVNYVAGIVPLYE